MRRAWSAFRPGGLTEATELAFYEKLERLTGHKSPQLSWELT